VFVRFELGDQLQLSLDPLFAADAPARRAMLAGLAEVRAKLGTPGAAARVARMAADLAGS